MSLTAEIHAVHIPPDPFDHEGCIEITVHGLEVGVRIHPGAESWGAWTPGKTVEVDLFLSLQGQLETLDAPAATTLERIGRWTYQVETSVEQTAEPTARLLGFPAIELDADIARHVNHSQGRPCGLRFIAELWGVAA